jgi:hypothetical protein
MGLFFAGFVALKLMGAAFIVLLIVRIAASLRAAPTEPSSLPAAASRPARSPKTSFAGFVTSWTRRVRAGHVQRLSELRALTAVRFSLRMP